MLAEGGEEEARRRSPERDALTLFDEGGVVVASSSPALLRAHPRLRVEGALLAAPRGARAARCASSPSATRSSRRCSTPSWASSRRPCSCRWTISSRCCSPQSQVGEADALLAAHFAQRARFPSPRAMAPMPVFGIPGWHPGTARESYYDCAQHFRPQTGGRGRQYSVEWRGEAGRTVAVPQMRCGGKSGLHRAA